MKDSHNTLYIIGNGFDIWHGLPTSYKQFERFATAKHPDIASAVEDYLAVDEHWADLEQALATMDGDQLHDELGHLAASYGAEDWSDSAHHDFQFEVERVVTTLSKELRAAFAAWVREVDVRSAGPDRLDLSKQARFFTFNYTDTLEKLYDIPPGQILHIHGSASRPTDTLVLGHARAPAMLKSSNDRPGIEDTDTRVLEANGIIDGYFAETFKPSDALIEANRSFFESLSDVDEVVIYGHSVDPVDAAYYRALVSQPALMKADWWLPSRNEAEFAERRDLLVSYGVPIELINSADWVPVAGTP